MEQDDIPISSKNKNKAMKKTRQNFFHLILQWTKKLDIIIWNAIGQHIPSNHGKLFES